MTHRAIDAQTKAAHQFLDSLSPADRGSQAALALHSLLHDIEVLLFAPTTGRRPTRPPNFHRPFRLRCSDQPSDATPPASAL